MPHEGETENKKVSLRHKKPLTEILHLVFRKRMGIFKHSRRFFHASKIPVFFH
tara:strand:- start:4604 stop:4762 length:159 start_codon:yes stop_codon:yes gene_type:complete